MTDAGDPKTPIDQALDLFVYLPLGFVLDFPSSMPRYIARGRRQLHVAKQVGREAISQSGDASKHLDRLQAHTRQTLRALGVAPSESGSANGNGRAPSSPALARPAGEATATTPTSSTTSAATRTPGEPNAAPTERGGAGGAGVAGSAATPTIPAIDVARLAIPDYDSLSASQVVPRLDSLALDELELVRQYEQSQRGRKTILSKVAQLQAG